MNSEINFEYGTNAPLIVLPVMVNDIGPYKFILDIGAGTSVISTGFAKIHKVITTGYKEGVAAGGIIKVALGKISKISLGKTLYNDYDVAISDEICRIGTAIGNSDLAGNLGYTFFKDHVLIIDYPQKKLWLNNSSSANDTAAIAFTLASASKPLVVIEVYINGKGPFNFALDTGASVTNISDELTKLLNLNTTAGPKITAGGGKVKSTVAQLQRLTLGKETVSNLSVLSVGYLDMLSKAAGKKLDGVLGYDFMKNYKISIDYINNLLHLNKSIK